MNVISRLPSLFAAILSLGINPPSAVRETGQNWCGTAEKMMYLKYRAEKIVEGPDSSLMYSLRPSQSLKTEVVEIHDQAICEKATRVYYRNQLGPYPADGVAVVRFGDRYGVLGDIHMGEWTLLQIYNLKFETIGGFGA